MRKPHRLIDFFAKIDAGLAATTCGRYYVQTFKDCSILLNQDHSGVVYAVIFPKFKLIIWANDIAWGYGTGYYNWARQNLNNKLSLPLNDTTSTFKENIADSSLLGMLDHLIYVKVGAAPLAIISANAFSAHRFANAFSTTGTMTRDAISISNQSFGFVVPHNLALTNVTEYLFQSGREGSEFNHGSWVKDEGALPPEIHNITLMPMESIKNRTKFIKSLTNNYFSDDPWFEPFKALSNEYVGYGILPEYLKTSTLKHLDPSKLLGEQHYFDKGSKKALTAFNNVWYTLDIPEFPVYKVFGY